MRSTASSFDWQYPLLSLRSSSNFLRLLPRLLVTSICPFIFPLITRCRRQFLRKMWPIKLAFRFLISCRIFLCSLTLNSASSFLTWSVQLIFSILLQHHISELSRRFWSVPTYENKNEWGQENAGAVVKKLSVYWHMSLYFSPFWCDKIPSKQFPIIFDTPCII